jgi:hypothetical protein
MNIATTLAKAKSGDTVGSDYDSVSTASTDSDLDGYDDYIRRQSRQTINLSSSIRQVSEQIRLLYDLSSILRRPKVVDRYISSVASKSNMLRRDDPDEASLGFSFRELDDSHIAEKLLQWRGLTKSTHGTMFVDEEAASGIQGAAVKGIEDISWFCQRLSRANTRRREQLKYWLEHPYDPKGDAYNQAHYSLPSSRQVHTTAKQEEEEVGSQASTTKPSHSETASKGALSAFSKQSFSTAALSDIHESTTNVRPRTEYAPTVTGPHRSNCVPSPPKAKDSSSTFNCPFCGLTLESNDMRVRQLWK